MNNMKTFKRPASLVLTLSSLLLTLNSFAAEQVKSTAAEEIATIPATEPKTKMQQMLAPLFNLIEQNAVLGIYRLSGFVETENAFLTKLNAMDLKVSDVKDDIVALGVAIKKYLRTKEIIEAPFLSGFLLAGGIDIGQPDGRTKFVNFVKNKYAQFRLPNNLHFKMVFKHLHDLAKKEYVTKMGPTNLGTVFGPNLVPVDRLPNVDMNDFNKTLAMQEKLNDFVTKAIETFPEWSN